MPITLDEAKNYLRVDYPDEDNIIQHFIETAEKLCADTLRKSVVSSTVARTAMLYAIAYLFEHRENADMNELTKSLRFILATEREAAF